MFLTIRFDIWGGLSNPTLLKIFMVAEQVFKIPKKYVSVIIEFYEFNS